ncbi:hypothetical protein RRF57_000308 [Xylaria bambusicola]|uniref:Uncharacterized protein n=1 Tax=Xylaria bambusicola TaxID=326684 RepID=A0AAN7Z2E4_9PEZI
MALWRAGDLSFFANIDCDLFRHHSQLDFTSFRVLATAAEKSRGFNPKITDLLFAPVPLAVHEWGFHLVFLSFFSSLFLFGTSLFSFAPALVVVENLLEVKLREFLDVNLVTLSILGSTCTFEYILEVVEEVFLEDGVFDIVRGVQHGTKETRDLFSFNV